MKKLSTLGGRLMLTLAMPLVFCAPALAQSESKLEITPFVGYRFGGDFRAVEQDVRLDLEDSAGFGVLADYSLTDNLQLEFLWSRQSSELTAAETTVAPGDDPLSLNLFDMSVDYLHGGLLYGLTTETIEPYLAGGIGATIFNPDAQDISSETRFSASLAAGAKGFVNDNIGFRFEFRGFLTRVDSRQEDVFCNIFGCTSFDRASTFWQMQIGGGVVIAF